MEAAVKFSSDVAKAVAKKYALPVFLYEKSAGDPARQNLADIRKGQFEGKADKIKLPEWKPDFGPPKIHPTAGVTACNKGRSILVVRLDLLY